MLGEGGLLFLGCHEKKHGVALESADGASRPDIGAEGNSLTSVRQADGRYTLRRLSRCEPVGGQCRESARVPARCGQGPMHE